MLKWLKDIWSEIGIRYYEWKYGQVRGSIWADCRVPSAATQMTFPDYIAGIESETSKCRLPPAPCEYEKITFGNWDYPSDDILDADIIE